MVIVAAERLFREALRALLIGEHGIESVGETAHGMHTVDLVRDLEPDVVLLETSPPEVDHVELVRRLKEHRSESRVLLLTGAENSAEICRALKAGARGYVSKNSGLADVRKAIHGVHHGDVWVERKLIAEVLEIEGPGAAPKDRAPARASGALTAREREILRRLASGGTNRHIADTLFISEKTVKTHLNNIFRKLNVTRRLQAVLYAIRNGLR